MGSGIVGSGEFVGWKRIVSRKREKEEIGSSIPSTKQTKNSMFLALPLIRLNESERE